MVCDAERVRICGCVSEGGCNKTVCRGREGMRETVRARDGGVCKSMCSMCEGGLHPP